MNWDDWKFFLAVARYNSLSRASIELQVSSSTVARRITELENSLGTQLFNRRPSGYWLTPAARSIFSQVEQSEAKFGSIKRALGEHSKVLPETVKIELPELLGQQLLIPALADLQQRHSELKFDIETRVTNSQLANRASDIVIRLNRPMSGAYTMRKLGELTQTTFCSADYFAKHREQIANTGLTGQFLIGWEDGLQYLPLAKWLQRIAPEQLLWLKTSTLNAQLEAVKAGLGIAVLPKFAALKFDLVEVKLAVPALQAEIWLMRNTESQSAGVDAVLAHFARVIQNSEQQLV